MKTLSFAALLVFVLVARSATAQSANSAPLELLRTIPLDGVEGRIDHLAIDGPRNRLFVAALGNGTVEVIDLVEGKRTQRVGGLKEPQGIGILPPSGRLVVASGGDGRCRVFDDSLKLVTVIESLDDADNIRIHSATKRVYVGYGSGGIAVVDAETLSKVADIALVAHPESFQLETRGKRIFVNVPDAGHIAVVDREKGVVVARWVLPGAEANFPMALDEEGHRLFVGCRRPAKLIAVDTDSGRAIESVDCCGDADDVFCDPPRGRIYVSGGEGLISVFERKNAGRLSLLTNLATAPGARTCLFVPDTGRLYLAVPHRGKQPAEIREYQVKP